MSASAKKQFSEEALNELLFPKRTPEEEQAFLALTPTERLNKLFQNRARMYDMGVWERPVPPGPGEPRIIFRRHWLLDESEKTDTSGTPFSPDESNNS